MLAAKLSLLAALSTVVVATHNVHPVKMGHHHDVARSHAEPGSEMVADEKRSDIAERGYAHTGIRATWYGSGQSACGPVYGPNDFIVALSQKQFGFSYPSSYCNKEITISYGGKTANAKIVDSCVGCPDWGLDFTEGLFKYFADIGEGVLAVDWGMADGSSGGGGDNTPKTTSTKKVVYEPKTTSTKEYVEPKTTSTKHTHTTHSTTAAPSTTTTHTTSTSTTSIAAPSGVAARCVSKDQRKRFMAERMAKKVYRV